MPVRNNNREHTFEILGFHPNPVNSIGTLEFTVNSRETVNLEIYDLLGKTVLQESIRGVSPGRVSFSIDMTELSTGVYFASLHSGNLIKITKIAVIK